MGLVYITFIMLRYVPMSLDAPEILSLRNFGLCQIFSFASNEMIIYFIAFLFYLYSWLHLFDLHMLNHT